MINTTAKTTLFDIYFAASYFMLTNRITHVDATKVITESVLDVINAAKVRNNIDTYLLHFYDTAIAPYLTKRVVQRTRPLIKDLELAVEYSQRHKAFLTYVLPQHGYHGWMYSAIPVFFSQHDIPNLKCHFVDSFSESELGADEPGIMFSMEEFRNNCLQSGYIKADCTIKVRVIAKRYDTKVRELARETLKNLRIVVSDAKKEFLKDNMQVWSFEILPNSADIENFQKSQLNREKLKKIIDGESTGKTYFAYLDDEQLSTKGFKSLSDIQSLIDSMDHLTIATDTTKTAFILNCTLYLLSFRNKKGDVISLEKFHIRYQPTQPEKIS